jgi:hypothetical protein
MPDRIGQVVLAFMWLATVVSGCGASKNDGALDSSQSDGATDGAEAASSSHGCNVNGTGVPCPPKMHCSFWHSCCDQGAACAYFIAGGDSGVPVRGVSCATDDMCLSTEYCQPDNQCCKLGYFCYPVDAGAGSMDSGDGGSDAD